MVHRDDDSLVTFLTVQELSKITMPVVFNEPLSFLQRLTEYMEHAYLIHKACTLSESIERMQVSICPTIVFVFYVNYILRCPILLKLSSWVLFVSLLLHLLCLLWHRSGTELENLLTLYWERLMSS